MFIGELLNWKAHIKYIQSKLSKSTAILYICSHLLDKNGKCILYNSLFSLLKLLYGDMGKHPTNTNNIFLLQKRVIRIVFGARRLDHTNSFFQKLISRYHKFENIIIYVQSVLQLFAMFSICLQGKK